MLRSRTGIFILVATFIIVAIFHVGAVRTGGWNVSLSSSSSSITTAGLRQACHCCFQLLFFLCTISHDTMTYGCILITP